MKLACELSPSGGCQTAGSLVERMGGLAHVSAGRSCSDRGHTLLVPAKLKAVKRASAQSRCPQSEVGLPRHGVEALLRIVLHRRDRLILTVGVPGIDTRLIEVAGIEIPLFLFLKDGLEEVVEHSGGVIV